MQSLGRTFSTRGSGSCVREPRHAAPAHAQVHKQPTHGVICRNWRAFGPTQEHNDGDAEFYQTASRLTAQYPQWFPQKPLEEGLSEPGEETLQSERGGLLRDDQRRPEFGLSTKQIQALNLGGMQSSLPDPVGYSLKSDP